MVGREFTADQVAELAPPPPRGEVGERLEALVRKALVRPERGTDAAAFGFRHQLLRDVAYEATSKRLRAELHERLAAWLEAAAAEALRLCQRKGIVPLAARARRQLEGLPAPS